MITTKLDKLAALLDVMEYDPETKTLTIDSDIKIKVRGNYKLETDKHVMIESNKYEIDDAMGMPYSVFINSDELEQRMTLNKIKEII